VRRRLAVRLAGVVGVVLLVAGCRLDVAVGVDSDADGTGRVRVEVTADAELVKAAGTDVTLAEDLRQAGWTVEGPSARPDGGATILATKPFSDPNGARQAFKELGGPFGDLTLARKHTLFKTTTSFRGTVDFTKGIEAFGDPGVRESLGGSDLGFDTKQIEAAVNGPIDKAFGVTVAARLPGGITSSNSPSTAGNGASWKLRLSDRAVLEAESEKWNTTNIAGLVVAALATVGLLALGLSALRRRFEAHHAAS
jgi:hypothetical protein